LKADYKPDRRRHRKPANANEGTPHKAFQVIEALRTTKTRPVLSLGNGPVDLDATYPVLRLTDTDP